MNQNIVNKRKKVLACSSYISIIGPITYLISKSSNDAFLKKHSKNSTYIFVATIFVYPVCKLISKIFLYYVSAFLGFIVILTYIMLVSFKLFGFRKAMIGD